MSKNFLSIGMTAILVTFLSSGLALAEEHASAALEHATAAASATEAEDISAHATEALKHTRPAKTANASHTDVVQHITESEPHLSAAVGSALAGDAAGAAQHAKIAKIHLEAANK